MAPIIHKSKSKAFLAVYKAPYDCLRDSDLSLCPHHTLLEAFCCASHLAFRRLRGLPLVPLSLGGTSLRESRPPFP